jgi:hypothetical protein
MNIIKIQDQLKGAPDDALIGYVQNPTGQVPTYLALSELERRKSMREKYQQGQPEKKTIAESIIEGAQPQAPQQPQMPPQQMPQGGVASLPEAQPMMQAMQPPPQMPPQGMAEGGMVAFEDGGLAELDVGNMFNEANYASGGIVAFAEGGDTEKGMNVDNMPSLNVNTGTQSMGGQGGGDYALKTLMSTLMGRGLGVQQPGMEGLLKAFPSKNSNIDYSNFDMLRTPGTLTTPDTLRQTLGLAGELYEKDPTFFSPERMYDRSKITKMAQGGEVRHYAQGDYVLPADYDPEAMMMQYAEDEANIPQWFEGDDGFGSKRKKAIKELQAKSKSPYDPAIDYYKSLPKPMIGPNPIYMRPENVLGREREQWFKSKPAMTPNIKVNPDAEKNNKNKTDNKVAENKGKPPFVGNTGADYGFEKVKGIGDYAKELQDYIGADPAKAGLQERLSKMDAAAAKQAEQAPWLALAKAGFEMANQRAEFGKAAETPFASLARGAGAGLKDYIEAKDKLTSLEEKRFGIANDLARSDRAERIAIAKFGADSKQAVEAANRHAKLQEQHDKVLIQMNNADNATRVATAGAKNIFDPKEIIAAKEKIRSGNPTYLSWYNDMTKKNKNIVNTPQFKREEEALVNELVMREGSLTAAPTIDTSQWSLGQPQR